MRKRGNYNIVTQNDKCALKDIDKAAENSDVMSVRRLPRLKINK